MLINKGVFSIPGSPKMDIKFESFAMNPLNPRRDLDAWLKIFNDVNLIMDKEGNPMVAFLPTKGFLDYIYLDDDPRITMGHIGVVVVIKILQQKIIDL